MNIKSNKGYVAIDMAVAIIGIIVFSGLIISLMYSNFLGNARTKKEAIAAIYLTEIMENVGIATYDDIKQDNIENLKPADLRESSSNNDKNIYTIKIDIVEIKTDIIKKVTSTISYTVGNKTYSNTLERIKIKE